MADLFNEVEMPLRLADMELAVMTTEAALAAMAEEFGTQLASLESRIYDLVGHPFNIGHPSSRQILFHELEPGTADADGSTDAVRRAPPAWPE